MTRRSRLYLKRRVAQARNDIDRALGKIVWLHDEFVGVHPDHAKILEAIAKSLILDQALLEDFWRVTWGSLPSDWDTYVGDGSRRKEGG